MSPLRVTVEVVPHGDESRAEVLDVITITQVAKLDHISFGLRKYVVSSSADSGVPPTVTHARQWGWLRLVARALSPSGS